MKLLNETLIIDRMCSIFCFETYKAKRKQAANLLVYFFF